MKELIIAHFSLLVFLPILVTQSDAVAQLLSSLTQPKGRLWGQVIDVRGDPVGSVSIVFSGENTSITAVADEQGRYQIELPAGVYKVSAAISGFSEFRRAAFRVQPDTAKILNIVPPFGGFTCIIDVTGRNTDPEKEGIGPPQHEQLSLPQLTGAHQELMVRFQLKRDRGGVTEYRGGLLNPKVMISYDFIAIYAESLRVDKNKGIVEAAGKIIIEDGQQRKRAKYARLEVQDGDMQLTTKKRTKE
jgi:hypothetical protein